MKKKLFNKSNFNLFSIILLIVLVGYTIYLFAILGWALIKSFHQFDDFILGGAKASSWPGVWTFDNYIRAFSVINYKLPRELGGGEVYLAEMVLNSLIYAVGGALVDLTVTACMAYVTARHKFAFNKVIEGLFYFSMLMPIYGGLGSTLEIVHFLHLRDTWLGMFILKFNFISGTGFLILRAAFKSLDDGYFDAAKIDGASHLSVMFHIAFPLMSGTLGVLFLTGFIGLWNDYTTPMIYLRNHPTASYGLYKFNQNKAQGGSFAYVTFKVAGFMILTIPMFIVFLLTKDKLMVGFEGGLKG